MSEHASLQEDEVQKEDQVVAFDVRISELLALWLRETSSIKVTLRTSNKRTNALFETKIVGRLVYGIKVGNKLCACRANWHRRMMR